MISGRLERYAINVALALLLMGVAAALMASPAWAQVTGSTPNGPFPIDSNTTTTAVVPDLDITKEDFPDPVDVGEELLYTIVVENEGDDPAQDVTIVDDLPDTVDLIDTDIIGGGDGAEDECEEQFGDDTLECELGDIDPGEEVRVEIRVRAEEEGEITNIAQVFVGDGDGGRVLVGIADESTEVTANDNNDNSDNDNDNGNHNNGGDDSGDGVEVIQEFGQEAESGEVEIENEVENEGATPT